MMENYERTMELVETAQDSAGRSEEQFAKYLDTVEYKLNLLKNSWELLRVSFLNSEMFKGAIDLINKIVVALQKIDFKKLLVMSPIIISIAKNFVMSFINTVQDMTKQFQLLGTEIGKDITENIEKAINDSPLPIYIEIKNIDGEIELAKAKLKRLGEGNEEIVALESVFNLSAKLMSELDENSEQYLNILNQSGLEADDFRNRLTDMAQREETAGVSALEASRNIEQLNGELLASKKKAEMMASGMKAVGQAIVAGIVAVISTGDIEAGLDAILASVAAFSVEFLASMGTTFATAALEAYTGSRSIGTAITEGLAATGPGLIIAGILAGLAGLVLVAKLAIQKFKEANKSVEDQIKEIDEKITELQKLAAELKDLAKEDKESAEHIRDLQERYEELNAIQLKTEEQQEEYNELIEQIKDEFPEIISSYDEQNNKLTIQKTLWEDIAKEAEKVAKESENAYIRTRREEIKQEEKKLELKNSEIENKNVYKYADEDELASKLSINKNSSEMVTAKDVIYWLEEAENNEEELTISDILLKLIDKSYVTYDENGEQLAIFNTELIEALTNYYERLANIKADELNTIEKENEAYERQNELLIQLEVANNFGTKDAQSRFIANKIADYSDNTGDYAANIVDNTDIGTLENWDYMRKYLGEENKLLFEDIIANTTDYEEVRNKLEELIKQTRNVLLEENLLNYMEESGYTEEYLLDFFSDVETFSKKEAEDLKNELENTDDVLSKEKADYIDLTVYDNLIEGLEGILSDEALQNMSLPGLEALNGQLAELQDKTNVSQEDFKKFWNMVELTVKNNDFGEDFINQIATLPWEKIDETNFSETIKSWAEQIAEDTEIPFEKVHELLLLIAEDAEKIGLADNLTRNEQEVEAFVVSLNEVRENAMKQKDTFIKAITDLATLGRLSLDNMVSLQKSLTELGEDYHDYITISNGQAILDQEKLKTLYAEKVNYQKRELQLMLDKAELEKRSLQLEYDLAMAIYKLYENEVNLLKVQELELKINMQDLAIEKLKTEIEFDIGDIALNDFNVDLTKSINSATKSIEDAAKKVADAEEKVTEATKKLNEALYGLEEHKNKLDFLYNYQTNLDRITKKANEAKEALEDLKGESATEQLDKYLSGVHSEAVTRRAENQVIQNSIDNYQSVLDTKLAEKITEINAANPSRNLSTNVSDYYTKVGDRLNVNFQALNAAQLPDDLSDYVEETIEQINKLSDEIEKNDEELKKREKEFLDMQKKARQDYIKLEDLVVSTLKEKYDEEIKATEDKYKAIEEADNEYLDALKEAIDKQRKLRDLANQWEDLQTKEKKLALMQRDTSGANASEINSLQEEIENDREQLLDNAVDNIIDSLKEMYDLQKETRDAELEYQKAVLDNAVLVQEANAIIDSWNSADDAVAWFYENTKDLSEMSVAKLEEETEQWRELYDTKTTYMATSLADFESALSTTAEEIQSIVDATSETLTTEADRSLTEITNKVTEAIKSAEKTLEDAIKALEEAKKSYNDATGGATGGAGGTTGGNSNNSNYVKSPYYGNENAITIKGSKGSYALAFGDAKDAASYKGDVLTINAANSAKSVFYGKTLLGTKDIYDILQSNDESAVRQLSAILFGDMRYTADMIKQNYSYLNKSNPNRMNAYASGGLVNYTGPAWVDGTPSKPEAFLSPEDTQRIGAAAQLLSNLPILNSTSNANTTVTSNIGDTAIDIHINIENVSSDYDVDQMIERVKQDIVDVSNPIGSPIILRK